MQTQFDDNGLVLPRKPFNPCVESSDRKNLHKEMKWNQRIGKNVLDQKNELEKVMEKRKDNAKKKELVAEKLSRRSSLEKRLEEQQLKLKLQEESANQTNNGTTITTTSTSATNINNINNNNNNDSETHILINRAQSSP